MEKALLQTLHCHTQNSDGTLTHKEVLDACAQNGVGVVAFTDHDTLPNNKQITELRRINHVTKYIWGIEVTSGYPKEVTDGKPHMFHIVGLFTDPTNKDLAGFCQEMHSIRLSRLKLKIDEFNKLGFKVSLDEVLATVTDNGIPTSLNLVNVLISNKENKPVIERYVKRMKELSKKDGKVGLLYEEMIIDDRSDKQKYFNTFMRDESPLKMELPEHKLPDMDSIVSLIRNAQGLAVLAHWSFERENFGRGILEQICKEKRIDGLETVYDLFLLDNHLWSEKFKTDRAFLRSLAKKYNLFESGGVDAHRNEDFNLFSSRKDYNRETVGLVEKIIHGWNPSLSNSSL